MGILMSYWTRANYGQIKDKLFENYSDLNDNYKILSFSQCKSFLKSKEREM